MRAPDKARGCSSPTQAQHFLMHKPMFVFLFSFLKKVSLPPLACGSREVVGLGGMNHRPSTIRAAA